MVVIDQRPQTAAQRDQERARLRYLESLRAKQPISGVQLGAEFGRTDRWGQLRIEEVTKAAAASTVPDLPEFSPQSLPPVTPPNSDSEAPQEQPGLMVRIKRGFSRRTPSPTPTVPAASQAPAAARLVSPQRRGASGVAWLAFGLGIVISVGANVGHIWFVSKPSDEALVAAMVFASFWPVALAVSVEVLSRVTWPAGFRWPGLLGTLLVGGVALVVSYRHMSGLLIYFGESYLSAALGPIGVDGLLVVGGFAIMAIGESKKRAR
jgi:hypothetical protein